MAKSLASACPLMVMSPDVLQMCKFAVATPPKLYDDKNDKSSFDECATWFQEANRYASGAHLLLVGNKIDITTGRKIEFSKAEEFAQDRNVSYFETSAQTGENVKKLFDELTKQIYVAQKQKDMKSGY